MSMFIFDARPFIFVGLSCVASRRVRAKEKSKGLFKMVRFYLTSQATQSYTE